MSGVYQTGLDALDREMAFSPLKMIPAEGIPWSAAVFLTGGVTVDAILKIYREQWPEPARFESWETQMPDLRQLIDLEAISMAIVILLVFGVVAIGIACSFVIFIIRNMREYGIMRAMGVTTAEMSALIVAKVTLMNLVACILSYLTVAENIGMPLTLNGIVGAARAKRIEALLADIDLKLAATALPHELSGGETQRVSVARAIAHHPKLLLADEPTANLDTATGQRIVQLMRDLGKGYGCTIIMATHDREITDIADPIIGLKDGQVVREEE